MSNRYQVAVFDMDGTVLNTIEDLRDAMHVALAQRNHRHDFTVDHMRIFFGSGIRVALTRALLLESGVPEDDLEQVGSETDTLTSRVDAEEVDRLMEIFNGYYPQHCADKTGPYEGVCDAIRRIREAGIRTAVVSNKPDEAVQKLVVDFFDGLFELSVGEKEGVRRKPFPDMTEAVLQQMGVDKKDAVYIGDSEIDLQTAANSGLPCIAVAWGFRGRRFLEAHGAETIIDSTDELPGAMME